MNSETASISYETAVYKAGFEESVLKRNQNFGPALSYVINLFLTYPANSRIQNYGI
jgi:hypothetical protein